MPRNKDTHNVVEPFVNQFMDTHRTEIISILKTWKRTSILAKTAPAEVLEVMYATESFSGMYMNGGLQAFLPRMLGKHVAKAIYDRIEEEIGKLLDEVDGMVTV
jgi:hypothetical protein